MHLQKPNLIPVFLSWSHFAWTNLCFITLINKVFCRWYIWLKQKSLSAWYMWLFWRYLARAWERKKETFPELFRLIYEGHSVNSVTGLRMPKISAGSRKNSHHPFKVLPLHRFTFLESCYPWLKCFKVVSPWYTVETLKNCRPKGTHIGKAFTCEHFL